MIIFDKNKKKISKDKNYFKSLKFRQNADPLYMDWKGTRLNFSYSIDGDSNFDSQYGYIENNFGLQKLLEIFNKEMPDYALLHIMKSKDQKLKNVTKEKINNDIRVATCGAFDLDLDFGVNWIPKKYINLLLNIIYVDYYDYLNYSYNPNGDNLNFLSNCIGGGNVPQGKDFFVLDGKFGILGFNITRPFEARLIYKSYYNLLDNYYQKSGYNTIIMGLNDFLDKTNQRQFIFAPNSGFDIQEWQEADKDSLMYMQIAGHNRTPEISYNDYLDNWGTPIDETQKKEFEKKLINFLDVDWKDKVPYYSPNNGMYYEFFTLKPDEMVIQSVYKAYLAGRTKPIEGIIFNKVYILFKSLEEGKQSFYIDKTILDNELFCLQIDYQTTIVIKQYWNYNVPTTDPKKKGFFYIFNDFYSINSRNGAYYGGFNDVKLSSFFRPYQAQKKFFATYLQINTDMNPGDLVKYYFNGYNGAFPGQNIHLPPDLPKKYALEVYLEDLAGCCFKVNGSDYVEDIRMISVCTYTYQKFDKEKFNGMKVFKVNDYPRTDPYKPVEEL